jgi:cytochrome c-type biogenesis protein CcmH
MIARIRPKPIVLCVLTMIALVAAAIAAHAVEPDEILANPALEARARDLSAGIRCLVCQNQSIDESNADLARDMRRLVRERIKAGESDQAIRDYLVSRYGDFVLLKPPMKSATWLLWFGPLLILLLGAFGIVLYFRSRRGEAPAANATLGAGERERLAQLIEKQDNGS